MPPVSREIITDCLAFTGALAPQIDRLDGEVRARAKADPRVKILTALPGVGQYTALVMLAETGDITRFPNARKLASWAGLTPTVRGSDLTVRHGHVPRKGSAGATGRSVMVVAGGLDLHRGQLTFDYVDLGTGESWRGRMSPADRESLRGWLRRYGTPMWSSRWRGAPGGATSWRSCGRPGLRPISRSPRRLRVGGAASGGPKTDWADARHLRQLVIDGRVPESWTPPAPVLDTRASVRLCKDLLEERTVHAVFPHTPHRRRSPPAFGLARQSRKGPGSTTFPTG